MGIAQEKHSPKTTELRGTHYGNFLANNGAQILRFEKAAPFARVKPRTVMLRGGGQSPRSGQRGVGIPWVFLGENTDLPVVHVEEGILPLQGTLWHH